MSKLKKIVLKDAIKILAEYIAQETLEINLHFYNADKVDLTEDGISKKQYLQDVEAMQSFYIEDSILPELNRVNSKAYRALVAKECKKK